MCGAWFGWIAVAKSVFRCFPTQNTQASNSSDFRRFSCVWDRQSETLHYLCVLEQTYIFILPRHCKQENYLFLTKTETVEPLFLYLLNARSVFSLDESLERVIRKNKNMLKTSSYHVRSFTRALRVDNCWRYDLSSHHFKPIVMDESELIKLH